MIAIKKYIIPCILLSFSISAKSQFPEECRYLSVLTYLRTNTGINTSIKSQFFKGQKNHKKDKFVHFQINDSVTFLNIYDFLDQLYLKEIGISQDLISNPQLYKDKYYFKPYKSEFLSKIDEDSTSFIYLTFSKPIDNYIIVEFGNMNPKLYGVKQWGLGLSILFKFNSLGLIEDKLYYGAAYR